MSRLRNITISVRSQAAIVLSLMALWCASFAYELNHCKERGSDFWYGVCAFAHPMALIFTIILWWSYWRSNRAHGRWVAAATLGALGPELWLLGLDVYLAI